MGSNRTGGRNLTSCSHAGARSHEEQSRFFKKSRKSRENHTGAVRNTNQKRTPLAVKHALAALRVGLHRLVSSIQNSLQARRIGAENLLAA